MSLKIEHFDADGNLIPGQTGGAIPLSQGGTGANLSATGPGVVVQTSTGADLSVETTLDAVRGGTEQTSVTAGDLLIGSGANAWAKLAATTNGFFLKLVAGLPAWAAVGYQLLRDGGTDKTQRGAVNFVDGIGTTVTLTDDAGNDETEVKVDLALDIQENGASVVATPDTINFPDSNVEAPGGNNADVYQDLPGICQGRLTLTSAVPFTNTDVTGASTVYFALLEGNKISLHDGTRWKKFSFTQPSLSLASHIKGVAYDIFGYNNSGTLTLESLAWKKVTATNSPTAGASKTININDTAGLAIGGEVTVKDGTNSEVSNITAVVANTSITVDNLANGYTLPDVYGFPTRATDLTTQDGVLVKSGDTTRRYLGSLRISRTTTGQCEDTDDERYLFSYYNRGHKHLRCGDPADSWTNVSTSVRAANANVAYGQGRVGFMIGVAEVSVFAISYSNLSHVTGTSNGGTGIGLDTALVNSSYGGGIYANGSRGNEAAVYSGMPGIGHHYLQRTEVASTGTDTYTGDAGVPNNVQTGMTALVEC